MATIEEKKVGISGPLEAYSKQLFENIWQVKGKYYVKPIGNGRMHGLLFPNSNLEMHYSTSPILLSYSFELCAAVRCQ
jgi:hypothetical protein